MLTVKQAADEATAVEEVNQGTNVIAVVHEDDPTGEGAGWNLLVAAADVLEEIQSRFAARQPLLRQKGTGPAVLSVLGPEAEILAALAA